jgi:oxygen-dependent protoporphyrinogen oxidase
MTHSNVQVAIVGGGITGLATAYYLQRHAAAGKPLSYSLIERSPHAGGKIITEEIRGFGDEPFIVEGGPDSFLTQKPWALQLARELGLEDRLLGTNDHARKVFVLNKGRPTPMPDGVLLIVPTRFMPFALSPLISPLGKLRMGLDLFIPARRDDEDETLAGFVRRRLGDEALDKIAEPLLSGIYNAEADKQSLLATFPRFRDIEKNHGSLIRGMLAARRKRATTPAPATPSPNGHAPTESKPVAMFVSLRGGTQEMVDTLVAKLTGEVRLNAGVTALSARPGGSYRLNLSDGSTVDAEQIILATPSYVSATLVRDLAPAAADLLDAIRYVSTGTLSFGFRRGDVAHPLKGFGILIPRSEQRPINAITWSSSKFDYRAPKDHVLLRVFFGGSRNPTILERSDDELIAIARSELKAIMGVDAQPVLQRLYRWPQATAQYDLGHLRHVDRIEAALPSGILVTGSPYRGIGMPDCVHQAQQTAATVWARLSPAPAAENIGASNPA